MNKQITNIILGVMGLAILGLYILQFTTKKSNTNVNLKPSASDMNEASKHSVVFINTDTFFEKYEEYKKLENSLQASQKSAENSLQSKMKALENDYMKLMQQAQQGQITPDQAQKKEKQILDRRTALEKESQTMMKNLSDKTTKATNSLYKTLQEYFKENKDKYNADFVMGYQTNGAILYFEPSLDITNQVIEDLNKKK